MTLPAVKQNGYFLYLVKLGQYMFIFYLSLTGSTQLEPISSSLV